MFDNARKTRRDWRRFRGAQKESRVRSWGQRLGAGTEQDPRSVRPETPPLVRPGFLTDRLPATPMLVPPPRKIRHARETLPARMVRGAGGRRHHRSQFPTHKSIAPVWRARPDARIFCLRTTIWVLCSPAHRVR